MACKVRVCRCATGDLLAAGGVGVVPGEPGAGAGVGDCPPPPHAAVKRRHVTEQAAMSLRTGMPLQRYIE